MTLTLCSLFGLLSRGLFVGFLGLMLGQSFGYGATNSIKDNLY